jgi:hypothetical protein
MGDILGAALVTFIGALLMLAYLPAQIMRRLVGQYRWMIDVSLHGSILWMFLGTSTLGLIQAEAAGIGISLYLRWYARHKGREVREERDGRKVWVRYGPRPSAP